MSENLFYNKLMEIEKDMFFLSNNSILGGNSGIALFYIYLYKSTREEKFNNKASEIIEREIERMNEKNIQFDFGSGITGFLWMLLHCKNENLLSLPSDFIESELVTLLVNYSEECMKAGHFDYFYGGLSASMYCLEDQSECSTNHLKFVIDHLDKIAIKQGRGCYWRGSLFKGKNKDNEEINFGLAHGIPSIITIISKIFKRGIEQKKCLHLLNRSIHYLLSNKMDDELSIFPSVVKKGINNTSSRLAWCYGDLGIAMSVWQAGKNTETKVWQDEAIKIMEHAALRTDLLSNSVKDACLCHGTAGIALIFYRFYLETSMEKFKRASNFWYDETLKLSIHKDGLSGFKNWTPDNGYLNNIGLLEGTSGIGLALMSAAFETNPDWDKCLLLS